MRDEAVSRDARALSQDATLHLGWYAAGLVVAFLLPFVFSSLLDLDHDLYYLIYFSGALAFLAAYAAATHLDVRHLFSRSWRWSLALGVIASALLVFNVVNREESTPHPDGLYFAFSIAWRGVVYGIVDALLLTAFPVAVTLALMGQRLGTLGRHVLFAALTFLLMVIITGVYHLGYDQYREDGIANPEVGNTIISVPALLTANPLGSVIAHASMHVAADVHAYETDVFLPPQVEADE